jgi:thiol-disulfide isomerase/thioredoxin
VRAAPAIAALLALLWVGPALALDDGELRAVIRSAGLVPYWSFKAAEGFSYPDVTNGRPVSLERFKNSVVLVNVWATWCPPCVREMPSLQALHAEFKERGLVVLGINVRDAKNAAAVSKWLTARHLDFPNVRATDDGPHFPSKRSIPQTFLIDRKGRLVANKAGPLDWAGVPVKALITRMVDVR